MAVLSNPPLPALPAVYISNERLRIDAVNIHVHIHLTAIRDWLGLHSNELCELEFSNHCARIGALNLATYIRVLLSSPIGVTAVAKKIINDYTCVVSGYPTGMFDRPLSNDMEIVQGAFHEQCLSRVARSLRDIEIAYERHQEELRAENEFFANPPADLPDSNIHRDVEQGPHTDRSGVMFYDEQDFLDAQNHYAEAYAEAYMDDYREEMAERYGDQMEDAGAVEDSFTDDAADQDDIRIERVAEVAQNLRNAQAAYNRVRKEARVERDATLPMTAGVWVMTPTADGRGVEASFEEHATVDDVRTGADGCPWPYFVYENHVKAEIAKGTDCPISLVPLDACKTVNVSMNCGHIYDTESIMAWAKIHTPTICPCCRAPIAGMWQMRGLAKDSTR